MLLTVCVYRVCCSRHALEPAQGVLVGVYSNMADSAIRTLPLERVARTNTYGQFTVRGLKPGEYRVFAINDLNRDNRWDRSEDVAFYDLTVSPSVMAITVNDTLRDSADRDSIVTRPGVAYLPDDVLLTWFNEDYRSYYLKDNARPDRRRVKLTLSAPYDTAATATIVNTPSLDGIAWDDVTVADISQGNDSITWWIRDPQVFNTDSLSLAVRYPMTDTLERVVWKTDTMRFYYRPSSDELKKAKEKAKRIKEGTDTLPPEQVFMNVTLRNSAAHEIYDPLIFESTTPWASVDSTMLHLEMYVDSLTEPVSFGSMSHIEGQTILRRVLDFDRQPGVKYVFTADSAAFTDIYGNVSKAINHEFTVKNPEEYSNVTFALTPVDTTAIVELLDAADKVVRVQRVASDGRVTFTNLTPSKYYARMYFDIDGNGKWTTGNVGSKLQPEEVSYYPKKIDARANWDLDLAWDIYQTPIDRQKPREILKNKPKLKKGEKEPNYGDDDEDVDEWGNPVNNRRGTNNNRGTGSMRNPFGGPGGLQQNTGGNSATMRPRR